MDRPLHRPRPQKTLQLRLLHHRVLHGRARRPHALHGDHADPRGLRRRRIRAQLGPHAIHAVLRHDARPRAVPGQGVRPRGGIDGRHGAGGEHQRRTGEQFVHVHREGECRAFRAHDHGHDGGGDFDDAVLVQDHSGHGRARGCRGDCQVYHSGRPRSHRHWDVGQQVLPQTRQGRPALRSRGRRRFHMPPRGERRGPGC
mmetsp:Transcript_879/g.2127  ORF Transcript_879/g.2127 Transcript_879/m.2127 type:complete len:200 (-) Transcript_879:679-1278(-)